jgi:hypothetical protein
MGSWLRAAQAILRPFPHRLHGAVGSQADNPGQRGLVRRLLGSGRASRVKYQDKHHGDDTDVVLPGVVREINVVTYQRRPVLQSLFRCEFVIGCSA